MSKKSWVIICALTILAPCLPLLVKTFMLDWVNHTWMINYCARFFAHHWTFPTVYNTYQLIGMGYPIFYGFLFFPFMGLFSTIFDSNVTVRLMAVAMFAAQFTLLYRTLIRFTLDRTFAFTIATIVTWAIYPLTNLYHRAALPEFFATGLLTCACIGWVRALRAESEKALKLWCNFSILCLCAAAGTHPITAIYGIIFFIGLIPLGLMLRPTYSWRKIALALLVPSLIATACMSPWVVGAGKYNKKFQIAESFHVIGFYRKTIDNWGLRLTPIPIPYRFLAADAQVENMGTRHLDAELNTPLLLAFLAIVFGLWQRKAMDKRTAIALVVTFAAAAWVANGSVTSTFDRLGHMARSIQFSYRLVTYCNLALLAGILLCVMYQSRGTNAKPFLSRTFATVLIGLSGLGLLVKLGFTAYLYPIEPRVFAWQRTDRELLQLPKEFYGLLSYSMPAMLPSLSAQESRRIQPIKLQPGEGTQFGMVKPFTLGAPYEFVGTNVQEFVWNKVLANGKPLAPGNLMAYDSLFVIHGIHPCTLSYAMEPDTLWSVLSKCSFPLFMGWIATSILISAPGVLGRRSTNAGILPAREPVTEQEIAH